MSDPAKQILALMHQLVALVDEEVEGHLSGLDPDTAAQALYLQSQLHGRMADCEKIVGGEETT